MLFPHQLWSTLHLWVLPEYVFRHFVTRWRRVETVLVVSYPPWNVRPLFPFVRRRSSGVITTPVEVRNDEILCRQEFLELGSNPSKVLERTDVTGPLPRVQHGGGETLGSTTTCTVEHWLWFIRQMTTFITVVVYLPIELSFFVY